MAAEQDATRDRVLAARAAFDAELTGLSASAREAVDIPAKVRRSPAKAAAIAGGIAFLLMRGPQRLWGTFRSRVFGRRRAMPDRMLPKEIEKTLDKLGKDGDKVRGTIERDFADYVKQRQKERRAIPTVLLLAALRPALSYGARRAMEIITAPPSDEPATRIGQLWGEIGTRAGELRAEAAARAEGARASAGDTASAAKEQLDRTADAAKERVDRARDDGTPAEEPPTGV
ncbi:MAG TPA: hypothetical protein VFN41_02555 [Candidatus Limnocylindrales bacterium]|nr:hypothetical protein [Candidatus Limnocylindrales bacterium]